jgi:putative cardiolipin synthase
VQFISDRPGKNDNRMRLGGGGAAAQALAELARGARERIVIQSPYVVLSSEAVEIMRAALARGVKIRISTNSLASTDNLPAFSGYRNQRDALLAIGLEIFEYKPNPEVMRKLMRQAAPAKAGKPPIFAIHAKSMVVDSKVVFVGTYNFDPRSQNLNTESGIAIHSEAVAKSVERAIETDMRPENSWNAAKDSPDRHASMAKRGQVRFWQATPITPLL